MDLNDSPAAAEYRASVRELLITLLPVEWRGIGALEGDELTSFLLEWRTKLVNNRLIAPGWPVEYGGGGLGLVEQSIVAEELVRIGAPHHPHPNDGFSLDLLGATVLHWGDDLQKQKFLPGTISGELLWAQGYSEPEAGSDLFNLRTTAKLIDDEWVINGQKIWQTAGPTANWIFALVRTDAEAVRSAGISFMVIPIDQSGVEVRGIKNMAGEIEFAEVFFTDARTPVENVIGGVNNGAKVALTLLGFERGAGGVADALRYQVELERLVDLIRSRGLQHDPHIRQRLAACAETVFALRSLGLQALTVGAAGGTPGPESSILKLLSSTYHQKVTELAIDVLGAAGLAPDGPDVIDSLYAQPVGLDPTSSLAWTKDFLHARPGTIYGGASEIQRNTIAEQVLKLPREPRIHIPTR